MEVPVEKLTEAEARLRGMRSEQRFFEAATVQLPETPYWLVAIEKAHVELDLRGVDAIAYIRYPGEQHV